MHINHQQVFFRETHNFKIGLKSTYEADVFLVEKLGDNRKNPASEFDSTAPVSILSPFWGCYMASHLLLCFSISHCGGQCLLQRQVKIKPFLSHFLSANWPHHSKINYQVCNWKADGKRILFDFWYKQQDRKDEKVKIHNVQIFLLSWVLFPAHWFIGRNYLGLDQSPSCRICSQSPWKEWRFYIVLYLGLPPFLLLLKVNFCFINKQL